MRQAAHSLILAKSDVIASSAPVGTASERAVS